MLDWWNSLIVGQQIYFCIALPASILLIIQLILSFAGADDDGPDGDEFESDSISDAGDGLSFFTLRGFIAMFAVMGWSGFALIGTTLPEGVSITISLLLGIFMLVAMAFLMRAISRLQSSGNLDISNAIGKVGQVYIPIPASAASAGKVNVTLQEKYSEFSAITMEGEMIPTGAYVRVVSIDDSGVLVVERISKPV